MHLYHLRCEMLVKRSISEVFAFFEDAGKLSKITPQWLNFQIISKQAAMRPGVEIEYNIRLIGIPMYWRSVITEYEPPFQFVDEQAAGPYRYWHHTHYFRPAPKGTLVGDHVEYALPLGPLGRIGHMLMVRPQLMAIFNYRQKALSGQFDGETVQVLKPVITER